MPDGGAEAQVEAEEPATAAKEATRAPSPWRAAAAAAAVAAVASQQQKGVRML